MSAKRTQSGGRQATDAFTSLARRLGVATTYRAADGTPRRASPKAIRALTAALGVDVGSEREARAEVRRLAAAERAALLPRVVVANADAKAVLPVPEAAEEVTAELVLEDGSRPSLKLRNARGQLGLGTTLPAGYHRVTLRAEGRETTSLVIAAPPRCPSPADLGAGGGWGVGAQAYGLRSARTAGVGDLEDLALLAEQLGPQGAAFLGSSPLHAMFPAEPRHKSPYSPSSRAFLNELLVAADKAAALVGDEAAPPGLPAGVGEAELIDYPGAAAWKMEALAALHGTFAARHLGGRRTKLGRAFEDWRAERGPELERHCRFNALQEHLIGDDPRLFDWREWPEGLRQHDAALPDAVAARAGFFAFAQWLAETQLAEAQARAKAAGLGLGLFLDLAVGVDPGGSAAWSDPDAVVTGATVGAPPDIFNPKGQNWGLAPLSPTTLVESGFKAFIADMRAVMRHAGAVRIDHAMALRRLYWIPRDAGPEDGAYISFPFEAMTAILALESQRHGCVVIGEDLGTVPAGFSPAMQRRGVLSMRVAWFEQNKAGAFKASERYAPAALAMVTTHDLPTARGFLEGTDIARRLEAGRLAKADVPAAEKQRAVDKKALLARLRREKLLEGRGEPDPETFTAALHRFLGRTGSTLVQAQIEDLTGDVEQPNLPGTVDEQPNWRRRLRLPVERLGDDPGFKAVVDAVKQGRAEAATRTA